MRRGILDLVAHVLGAKQSIGLRYQVINLGLSKRNGKAPVFRHFSDGQKRFSAHKTALSDRLLGKANEYRLGGIYIETQMLKKVEAKMNSQATSTFGQFLLLMAIALAGCVASRTEGPELSQPTKTPVPIIETNQVVLYDEWPSDGFPNDAAKITATALENNILTIKVVYQGDCQEHTFELHAWTAFLASQPPQGVLYLSHDSHGDTCTDEVEKLLTFDLTPLNKERNDPSEYPLLLRLYEPVGGSFATEPVMPLVEWP